MVTQVKLGDLHEHSKNTRNTPADKSEDEQLRASLSAIGLLNNLVVSVDDGRHRVIDGARRVQAMRGLGWPDDTEVPCLIVSGDDLPEEVSLAANVVRASMHPADQIDAFSALALLMPVSRIAERFGVSENLVYRRIRLSGVHPDIRRAYKDGEISMSALEAFGSTAKTDLQLRVWKKLCEHREQFPYVVEAAHILRQLDDDRISVNNRIAAFVGVEEYEAAGGAVERDLFSDEDATYLTDLNLLEQMAHDKLRLEVRDTRWAWVETFLSPADIFTAAKPLPQKLTQWETAQLAQLDEEFEKAVRDHNYALQHEVRTERNKLSDMIAVRNEYSDEVREKAGCAVMLGWDGEVIVKRGMYKDEDAPAPNLPQHVSDDTGQELVDEKQEKPLSARAVKAVRRQRTHLIGQAMSNRDVLDLLTFTLTSQIAGSASGLGAIDWLDLKVNPAFVSDFENNAWLNLPDPEEAFDEFQKLPAEDRDAYLRAVTASLLRPQLSTDAHPHPVQEHLARRVAWPDHKPGEWYFNLLTRKQIMALADNVLGERWVKRNRSLKKNELVAAATAAFAEKDWMIAGFEPAP